MKSLIEYETSARLASYPHKNNIRAPAMNITFHLIATFSHFDVVFFSFSGRLLINVAHFFLSLYLFSSGSPQSTQFTQSVHHDVYQTPGMYMSYLAIR